jgi:leucyl aminopeptidase
VLLGLRDAEDFWSYGALAGVLPPGRYRLEASDDTQFQRRAVIAWGLGAYRFERYKTGDAERPALVLERDYQEVADTVEATYLVRDLINTPAEDMMPQHLAAAARKLAEGFGAEYAEVVGDSLLEQNYPLIHAVGRASVHPPRLIELRWGAADAPRVTLVGKGVCFDSGGLDIKPATGMRLMKKDMGGAAHALGLARMIMGAGLPVRLHVLVAAAENAISGSSLRPGDVIRSRKGLTIEIENTDAEGRLVLCDALARADEEEPELLIDFATLTGAARVALGTEVPAFFTTSDTLAGKLMDAAEAEQDLVWRLPLHRPYRRDLRSDIADLMNCSTNGFGGAITAALFLQRFVPAGADWLHLDLMAWNLQARPGRPKGGEAMGLQAVFRYLRERYGAG